MCGFSAADVEDGTLIMWQAAELLSQASVARLISKRELAERVAHVQSLSSDDHVRTIAIGSRPIAYVKQPESTDSTGRERANLEWLADLDCVPRLLDCGSGEELWVRALRGHEVASERGRLAELAETCEAWGESLAELHAMRVSPGAPFAPRPWVLTPGNRPPATGAAAGRIGRFVDSHPLLRRALHQVDERWTERHWIHGDLGPNNVVVEHELRPTVRFVDFDRAGRGDPAWDLATVLDCLAWLAPDWRAPVEPLTEHFLRGYRQAGGRGVLFPAMQAARALATAWQVATGEWHRTGADVDEEVERWLDRTMSWADRALALPLAS
jgi:aminoglycoside phosphotransferase